MVAYCEEETTPLAHEMPAKAITLTQDETLAGGLGLAGIEPVSNAILLEDTAEARAQAQVQGVRLNHGIFFGRRSQLCYGTVLGYDAVERTLRQEVHHGHYSTADSSCSSFAFGSWRTPAPGGRHRDRPPHPAPPGAWTLVWSRGRSLGPRDSGWASCPLQGGATAGRAGNVGAAAAGTHTRRAQ